MSKIYNLIESQVNTILRLVLEDDRTGQIDYGWLGGAKYIQPLVMFITSVIFLFIILNFGLYLWNFGLAPVFPGLVAPISAANPSQASNPLIQLVITFMALMLIS